MNIQITIQVFSFLLHTSTGGKPFRNCPASQGRVLQIWSDPQLSAVWESASLIRVRTKRVAKGTGTPLKFALASRALGEMSQVAEVGRDRDVNKPKHFSYI